MNPMMLLAAILLNIMIALSKNQGLKNSKNHFSNSPFCASPGAGNLSLLPWKLNNRG